MIHKIRTIHKLCLWLYYDFFGKSSIHIANCSCQDLQNEKYLVPIQWYYPKILIKSQRQIKCGSNFYEADVIHIGMTVCRKETRWYRLYVTFLSIGALSLKCWKFEKSLGCNCIPLFLWSFGFEYQSLALHLKFSFSEKVTKIWSCLPLLNLT